MARISSNVLQGLSSPSFAQGMFTAGAALGGIPGQLRDKRKKDKFNEIMKRGQAALASAEQDPVVLSGIAQELSALGYTEEAKQFSDAARKRGETVAARARASGLLTQASTQDGITPEYAQDFLSAGGTLEQLAQGRTAADALNEPLREKGRGRLRAMAQTQLFDPQDPGQLQGFFNVAERHKVSPNEAMKILAEERGTQLDRAKLKSTASGRAGTTTFAGANNYLDKRNLEYRLTEVRDPTGQGAVRTEYQPVGHKIPYEFSYEDEQGNIIDNRLTQKGGAYGETAGQRLGRFEEEQEIKANLDVLKADTIKENENFSDVRMKAAARLPQVEGTLSDVNELLDIIERVDQGGSIVGLQNRISRVLGSEAKDEGDLRTRAKELLVGRIKAFGANPTEGERQYLEQLIPDLENSKGVNKVILERLQQRLQRERASIGYLFTEKANLDGYISFVNDQYSGDPNSNITGNKRVKFDEIQ